MAHLTRLHSSLMNTILFSMLVLVIWGVFTYARRRPATGTFAAALIIGELLILAEALLGIIILVGGAQPARLGVHLLYGIVALVCLPGAFAYTRGRNSRWEGLIYAGVCLFLAAIAIRARQTGMIGA